MSQTTMHTQLFVFFLIAFILTPLAHTSPTQLGALSTPPPPGKTYVVGYPVCEIAGYTEVPGNYNETVHQQTGATLSGCINECRSAYPACKSMAYHARYTLCLWFDKKVDKTQLYGDVTSEFVHYDLICPVPSGC